MVNINNYSKILRFAKKTIPLLPIIFVSLFLLYEKQMAVIAITPLGKIISILLIVYYASIDIVYGLLACALVILYFQSDYIEGFQNSNTDSTKQCNCNTCKDKDCNNKDTNNKDLNNTDINKLNTSSPINVLNVSESVNKDVNNEFRTKNCKNENLVYKNAKVRLENAEHIFPELSFSNKKCNPCADTCEFSIIEEQLKISELIKPKTSDDFSMNTMLNKIGNFIPALWTKSEPFATFE